MAIPYRRLVLIRHAKSAWPEDVPDHERPLGPRGRRDAPALGRLLQLVGWAPDHVVCSTASRARQTWRLIEEQLNTRPPVSHERAIYESTAAELIDVVRDLPAAATTVAVVGHDPAIPQLAVTLAANQPTAGQHVTAASMPAPIDRLRRKFPTAAMAVLEISGSWSDAHPAHARLMSFVTPRDIANLR